MKEHKRGEDGGDHGGLAALCIPPSLTFSTPVAAQAVSKACDILRATK